FDSALAQQAAPAARLVLVCPPGRQDLRRLDRFAAEGDQALGARFEKKPVTLGPAAVQVDRDPGVPRQALGTGVEAGDVDQSVDARLAGFGDKRQQRLEPGW